MLRDFFLFSFFVFFLGGFGMAFIIPCWVGFGMIIFVNVFI